MWKAAKAVVLSTAFISAVSLSLGTASGAMAAGTTPATTTANASSVYAWKQIDNQWYFMDQYGNKKTGWITYNGETYYLNQQGIRQSGWIYQLTWHYLSPADGHMVKNQWVTDKGLWYYINNNGSMLRNTWVEWNGGWYYLSSNGSMLANRWFYDNAQYYLDTSGKRVTGWKDIAGKWYYFYSSGVMARDAIINGYMVGEDGAWMQLEPSVLLNAPLISQLPQLPKGCEVTSLAMMLNYAGFKEDKMTLASQIKKIPYFSQGYYGNPNDGFVGNMYTPLTWSDGYGPNHGPVFTLAKKYLGTRAIDITGQSFTRVLQKLNEGKPVWVIHTFGFAPVPSSDFFSVRTREGVVKINSLEHSVLITGYDSKYIYFNDPYANIKNRKADRAKFIAAWVQLGSQAISYN